MRIGVAAIARPTFDVAFAEETAAAAISALGSIGEVVGQRDVAYDDDAVAGAAAALAGEDLDALVVVQASFTDSTLVTGAVAGSDAPLLLWAFPEDRTGGRLRLNSLCGINLAGYVLRRAGRPYRYLYAGPTARDPLAAALAAPPASPGPDPAGQPHPAGAPTGRRAEDIAAALAGARIGLVGEHPTGFEPCAYEAAALAGLTGVEVDETPLERLFAAAAEASDAEVAAVRASVDAALTGTEDVDQDALAASLRLHLGLRRLVGAGGWAGVATRCWPECFTEFGGAACAPQAMLTDDGVPGGCEADAYGTLTSLLLRELAHEPPFVADLVDIDVATDTATLWHCGVAPLHMADPAIPPRPTVHSNRVKPLLHEFPLKPGRVTVARLSQAAGSHSLVIGGGEMLRAPLAYSGTAGVMRFDRPAAEVLTTVMGAGLEHHYGIVYGDYRDELQAVAGLWNLPTIQLS